jgi:uncharacterized membrane protein required for colicin V production
MAFLFIDLIIVLIIVLSVVISAKHGFVRVVIEVAGFVAAAILALTVSGPLADFTYEKAIEPPIVNSISESVSDAGSASVNEIWDSMPNFVTKNAEKYGISKQSVEETVLNNNKGDTEKVLTDLSQNAIKPVVVGILEVLYSVILIVVLVFVVKILAKLINKAFSFSIIGKLNKTLGGVLGFVKGLIYSLLFCEIVVLIMSFTANGILIFTGANIAKTYLFNFLTNLM